MFKFFAVVVLVLFTLLQCDATCYFSWGQVNCSFEDLYNPIYRGNTWAEVIIRSEEKQKINATIVTSILNVQEIYFVGSVNDIADLTFASLPDLKRIEFHSCELTIIKKNSFILNSNSNVTLRIVNSKVNYLEPNFFDKSTNLYELILNGNNIYKININVFNGTLITYLNLDNNNIKFIEENALSNMPHLRELHLDENLLTRFDAKLYINNVPNLLLLSLAKNKIEFLNKNNFISFSELRVLYLYSNKIQRIEDNAFNGLTKLFILDINNNSLYSLPETSVPYNGLPSLELLNIGLNRLNYLSTNFLHLFPKLKWIDIFRNPWQCTCYKDIINALSYANVSIHCADQYLNGKRPVCVVPRTGDGKCNENIPDPNKLYEIFSEGFKEYDHIYYCKLYAQSYADDLLDSII